MNRRMTVGLVAAIASVLILAGKANAWWDYPGTQAYLRSVATPAWFVDYPADSGHSYGNYVSAPQR